MPLPTAATVGGKVSATIFNGLRAGYILPSAQFTATSASVASATVASVGTLTLAGSNTAGATIATISTNTLTIAESAIYDVSVSASLPATPTGSTFVSMSDGTNGWRVVSPNVNGVWGGAVISGYYFTAGTVLTFTFLQTSAAARVLTSAWNVTKIGYYS